MRFLSVPNPHDSSRSWRDGFSRLVRALRNTSVRNFVSALHRDGFVFDQDKRVAGSHRVYEHYDGRRVVIAYHKGSDTLPLKTLQEFLKRTEWNAEDAIRLKLLKFRP